MTPIAIQNEILNIPQDVQRILQVSVMTAIAMPRNTHGMPIFSLLPGFWTIMYKMAKAPKLSELPKIAPFLFRIINWKK